jgi:cobalt-zinc-cadmium efflux system outer membrane protein
MIGSVSFAPVLSIAGHDDVTAASSRIGMRRSCILSLFVTLVLLSGCKTPHLVRDPEYARVSRSVYQASHTVDPVVDAIVSPSTQLEGRHAVEEYVAHALRENPDIQVARKRMEAFAHQVPVAASLEDPRLNVTVQPEPIQTAAGPQDVVVSASQKFHWLGKLGKRAGAAESQTTVARAQLAAAELGVVARVKRAYYELYFLQQAIAVTEAEQELLVEIRDVANVRYKSGQASQQDVLRADLEISDIENQLIRLRQQLESAQARLARILHVSPQTQLLALEQLPEARVPDDLERLQRQAVSRRPELHANLAAVQRDRAAVELARLDYKPDVTLGVSWIGVGDNGISPIANGRDSILLAAGMNLPVYRKRLDSAIRSTEAKAVSTARQYDSLRDATLEEVTDLFSKAKSQQEMLTLFREDILPKSRQTLEVSSHAYNVGEVDFLTLIDNWRQLLRHEVNYERLQASLRQSLADLEQVVGGFQEAPAELIPLSPATERLPAPDGEQEGDRLENENEKNDSI